MVSLSSPLGAMVGRSGGPEDACLNLVSRFLFINEMKSGAHPSIRKKEAEGQAALAGLHALAEVYSGPIILEMDCSMIANNL